MPMATSYVLITSMDVVSELEALFNEVYDEHVAHILKVPGVRHVTRMKGEPFLVAIGGTTQTMPAPDPVYTAIYEIDDPGVLVSKEWTDACEAGRWPTEIRPHTRKRIHAVYRIA